MVERIEGTEQEEESLDGIVFQIDGNEYVLKVETDDMPIKNKIRLWSTDERVTDQFGFPDKDGLIKFLAQKSKTS